LWADGGVSSGGQTGFDVLVSSADPSFVQVELDLCWAVSAGQNPVALFRARAVSDYARQGPSAQGGGGTSAPIPEVLPDVEDVASAEGVIDWKAIFAQASVAASSTTARC
jgi:sugar phosphate isomerase/epimerase